MAHEFVVVTPHAPDVARALLEPVTARRLPPRVEIRIVPSVAGANVHVRLHTPFIWWLLVLVPPFFGIWLILAGTLDAKRAVLVAVTDEPPPSLDQRKLAAVAGLALIALTGFVAWRAWAEHRDARVVAASFPLGATRKEVIASLGWPDAEWAADEYRHRDSDPSCASGARAEIDYYGYAEGVYCFIYLDARDRVVCVETSAGLMPSRSARAE